MTWMALGHGVTAVLLALAALWAVVASGLFSHPADATLVPAVASWLYGMLVFSTVRAARKRSRAPMRHGLAAALGVLAVAVASLAGYAWYDAATRVDPVYAPPASGMPSLWRC